jgi:regulator of replication initiation timing
MQTLNHTADRASSAIEQAFTKVLNEKYALQAENTALRAALEAVKEWNDGDLDSYGNSEYSFRAEFILAALVGKGVQS